MVATLLTERLTEITTVWVIELLIDMEPIEALIDTEALHLIEINMVWVQTVMVCFTFTFFLFLSLSEALRCSADRASDRYGTERYDRDKYGLSSVCFFLFTFFSFPFLVFTFFSFPFLLSDRDILLFSSLFSSISFFFFHSWGFISLIFFLLFVLWNFSAFLPTFVLSLF